MCKIKVTLKGTNEKIDVRYNDISDVQEKDTFTLLTLENYEDNREPRFVDIEVLESEQEIYNQSFDVISGNESFVPVNNEKKIYIAIPYSFNPELSFELSNRIAAQFMDKGYIVFSPVSHTHIINKYTIQDGHDFWIQQDLPQLRNQDIVFLIVVGKDGYELIKQSQGCQDEIKEAKEYNIPIRYIPLQDEYVEFVKNEMYGKQ